MRGLVYGLLFITAFFAGAANSPAGILVAAAAVLAVVAFSASESRSEKGRGSERRWLTKKR